MSLTVLIAGCGDVGSAAAERLAIAGHAVTGLRRRTGGLPARVRPLAADLTEPATLEPAAGSWDVLVYCPTPGERSEAGYRSIFVDGFRRLLAVVRVRRVLFVSSTAVYGEDTGAWVDETSESRPAAFNGEVLLEAEQAAREAAAEETIALRLGGIYGPGRDYLVRAARRAAGQPTPAEPPHWTNRIHRDDASALVAHLATLPEPAGCYNGVDSAPATRFEVLAWLAERLGLPAPVAVRAPGGATGKRVSNRRSLASGFAYRHADYRAGYGALLAAAGETA